MKRDKLGRFIKGFSYNPTTQFKKGNIPHNKGKRGLKNNGGAPKGHISYNSGRTHWNSEIVNDPIFQEKRLKKLPRGKKHYRWKGNEVGYWGLHEWVYRIKGKPMICIFCGTGEKLEWANRSQQYQRNTSDWISLCISCHRGYDKEFRRNLKLKLGYKVYG